VDAEENILTCKDAFGIMCQNIRAIARELGYGTLKFPNSERPVLICEVHNGLIKQVDVVFNSKTKRYRAD
jgi:hypothetical protein